MEKIPQESRVPEARDKCHRNLRLRRKLGEVLQIQSTEKYLELLPLALLPNLNIEFIKTKATSIFTLLSYGQHVIKLSGARMKRRKLILARFISFLG